MNTSLPACHAGAALDLLTRLDIKNLLASMAVLIAQGLHVVVWGRVERAEAKMRRGVHRPISASNAETIMGNTALCRCIRWSRQATAALF